MEKPSGDRFTLYDAAQLNQVLDRMAAQAASLLHKETAITFTGIVRRGAPLAQQISERLAHEFGMAELAMLPLTVKRYADDLTVQHPETMLVEPAPGVAQALRGKTVVLVDDVLYGGYSMLRAVSFIQRFQPAKIYTAVLVDRGVSSLPIRTDIVGLRLDVPAGWVVECNVPPYEPVWQIELCCLAPSSERARAN